MKKHIIIGLFCLFNLFTISAQSHYQGQLLSFKNKNAASIAQTQGLTPSVESVSLRPFCPPIGSQGLTEACAAYATAYGAMGILAAKSWGSKATPIFSASYIYNATVSSNAGDANACKKVLSLDDALSFLQKEGTCLAKTFPNDLPCSQKPNKAAKAEACQFRIEEYESLFSESYPPEQKIAKVCAVLAQSEPVVVSLQIDDAFRNFKGQLFQPTKNEAATDAHALVVVGFDKHQETVELMNSWGTSWGDGGFAKMHFNTFLKMVKEAFKIDGFAPKMPTLSKGVFSVKNTEGGQLSDGVWVNRQGEGAYFQLSSSPKKAVQLHSTLLDGDGFLYLFQKDRVILEREFAKNTHFILPTTDESLNTDFCLLISNRRICDFEQRFDNFKKQKGSIEANINTAFSDIVLPFKNLKFEQNTYEFSFSEPPSTLFCVPIVVKY